MRKDDKIGMSYLLNDPVYNKIIANNFNEKLLKAKFTWIYIIFEHLNQIISVVLIFRYSENILTFSYAMSMIKSCNSFVERKINGDFIRNNLL